LNCFDPYDEGLYGSAISTPEQSFLLASSTLHPSHHYNRTKHFQLQSSTRLKLASPYCDHVSPAVHVLNYSTYDEIDDNTNNIDDSNAHKTTTTTPITPLLNTPSKPILYSPSIDDVNTMFENIEIDLEMDEDEKNSPILLTQQEIDDERELKRLHDEYFEELKNFFTAPISHTRTATIQRAYEIFRHLDRKNNRGLLDLTQLSQALSLFSTDTAKFSPKEVETIFNVASSHHDGFLRFADFYSIFACLTLIRGKFGTESTFLTHQQIKSALMEAGLDVNSKHLQHMFAVKASGANITDADSNFIPDETNPQVNFVQLLEIYISAPRSESDLFLFSWYKAGKTNFLLHKQHLEASPAQDFIAGTSAGIALTLVGHPFDTIKVRMQTGGFTNPIIAIRQTISKEGPFAVYKGMAGPMLTIPIINALVFTCYAQAQSLFKKFNSDPQAELTLWQIALAGMYAGLINCAVACPVELVKTRLQIQYGEKGSFRGPIDCIQHILRASGPKGLFRGMTSTIYRELPGYGAQFYFYEWSKRFCMKSGNRSEFELTPFELLMSGGFAGLAGWIFSYPMDYIKSQIQAEPWNKKSRYKKHPILFDGGFFSCAQATIKRHGWKELWRGFSVCAARGFPANAAGFLAYETTLAFMRENQILTSTPRKV
jgi:solute carrier family 25 carnitine/acylcarnitine transporter 20/29